MARFEDIAFDLTEGQQELALIVATAWQDRRLNAIVRGQEAEVRLFAVEVMERNGIPTETAQAILRTELPRFGDVKQIPDGLHWTPI